MIILSWQQMGRKVAALPACPRSKNEMPDAAPLHFRDYTNRNGLHTPFLLSEKV